MPADAAAVVCPSFEKVRFPVGSTRNQCPSCGLRFGGVYAFDRHRTGMFGSTADPRRCRAGAELAAVGLVKLANGDYGRPIKAGTFSQAA